MPLPPGVREVILARLQQLSKDANALLLAAAVVGRACTFERLRQVADIPEDEALATVEALHNGRLLSEKRAERRPYTLAHDYIREVVYEESREARRRVFHRRALLALEADRAPAAECAFHALASLLDEPAFRFSLAAGDEALATWAFEESLAHYNRARDVARRMAQTATAITSRSVQHLYENRGRALELIEDYEAAQANYEEMLAMAAERHDQTLELAALTAQCIIHARHNPVFNPSRAREEGQAALALARTLDDRAAEARALWGMMLMGIYGGGSVPEIMTFGQRSLALARELGLKEQMGYVLVNLCWPYMAQKQLAAAIKANDEALAVWQALGNPPRLLEAYEMRQWLLTVPGDLGGVMAAARETLRLSRLTANQGFEGNALRFMAHVHLRQGRFAQALACAGEAMSLQRQRYYSEHANDEVLSLLYRYAGALEESEQWADKLDEALQATSVPLFENFYLMTMAGAKIARGKLAEGQAILDRMLEGVQPDLLWSHMIILKALGYAQLQLARGRPERVFDLLLEDRVQDYRRAGFHYFLAEEHWLRGKAWLAMREFEKARVALLQAREVAAIQEERTILWQILAALGELEQACGNAAAATEMREQARAVVDDISAHAGPLRDTFLSQPAVAQLLGDAQATTP
jgi:tetratricopeptide (TPR) repeat protein